MIRGKARGFKLHVTLLLQVCSIFYLATNTNGTLRGFFYHLFSVIYASLIFAVCFVVTFESLAKTVQVLKTICGGYSRSYTHVNTNVHKYKNSFDSSKDRLVSKILSRVNLQLL